MPDNKNTFDFGTGSIDRDQWLRDIDSGLEEFISMYGNVANKHRTTLLRQAFQDLRRRIANGDMLNRTADGLYQFGSALNREDKYMLEAYQRALGFMGNLARTQIKAPTPLEEKKYGTSTLLLNWLKYLNPSGEFNSKSYWEGDDTSRIAELKKFLERERAGLGVYTGYEGYKDRADLESRIDAFMSNPTEKNLQRLGFKGLNWITKPVEEAPEEEPKSELQQVQEQIAAQLEAQQIQQGRQYLNYNNNKGVHEYALTPSTYNFDLALQNNLDLNRFQYSGPVATFNPGFERRSRERIANDFVSQQLKELDNYFSTFATGWKGIYDLGEENRNRMSNYLARLFSTYNTKDDAGNPVLKSAFNWQKYFTLIGDNQYLINGSLDNSTGRYAFYVPGQGIKEANLLDTGNHYIAQLLNYTIPSLKEGGRIEFLQQGGGFDYSAWEQANTPKPKPSLVIAKKSEAKSESNEGMDTGDWVTIIGTTVADIGSMLSANAVGWGTIASAGLGLTSTLGNSINELRHGDHWGAATNLGLGLTADLIGLVPGAGAGAKGWKIGKTLTRFARPILAAMAANNYKEAGLVMNKGLKNGWGNLSAEDWALLATTLTSIGARGKSAHTRLRNVEFTNRAVLKSSPRDEKGNITNYVINEQGLIDARKELRDEKHLPINTPNKSFGEKLWRSIPPDLNIKAPYYTKPFPWESFKYDFGKSRSALIDKWELYLNNRRNASPVSDTVIEKYGGVLKALRNGGIIKALAGTEFPGLATSYKTFSDWGNLNWGTGDNLNFKGYMTAGKDKRNGITWSKGLYANDLGDQNMESAYFALQNYYDLDNGANIMGDVKKYYDTWIQSNAGKDVNAFILDYNSKVDELRNLNKTKTSSKANSTGWTRFNELHHLLYPSYGLQGDGSDDWSDKLKDILGESTWRRVPNTFKSIGELQDRRSTMLVSNDPKWQVAMDNQGHLITNTAVNPEDDVKETSDKPEKINSADQEIEGKTDVNKTFKNPWDPTLLITAGKTALGLLGNRNIYKNLLDEMPQAPLRDPIDRKLAIVGWQERIKQGQNELADLRRVQQRQQGADQQTNFATALETERVGRDIMDKTFMEDSGRLFETAGKSWNLDNEDTLYNLGVGDANRKAIADRARMMAQIRAAWRSGDNNILMGALADTGNWWLKKYLREQDLIDRAKALELGTPEEWAQSEYTSRLGELANKKASELTTAEEAQVKAIKALVLRDMRKKFSLKYYDTFRSPMFGVGYNYSLAAKDGTKLEVAKLRARSKDNDRYVSMVKDLRRRRRR